MNKLNVIVLQGGESPEHDVSLSTAGQIVRTLKWVASPYKDRYAVRAVTITRDGKWMLPHDPLLEIATDKIKKSKTAELMTVDSGRVLTQIKEDNTDIVFIALHGGAGEDGRIQALLELMDIPYTGSGPLASGLAMDKVRSQDIYRAHGLHVPYSFHFGKRLWDEQKEFVLDTIAQRLLILLPLVVKPADQGSSVGVSLVRHGDEIIDAIDRAFQFSGTVIVQQYIYGKEATCGVLEKENGEVVVLPTTHIVANAGAFYDYQSKYQSGGSTHVCPADFDSRTNSLIQEAAVAAHRALGCSGMSRTDFIVGDDGVLYALETNTIPGMTPTSLLPEAAAVAGIDFPALLDMLIARGLTARMYENNPSTVKTLERS